MVEKEKKSRKTIPNRSIFQVNAVNFPENKYLILVGIRVKDQWVRQRHHPSFKYSYNTKVNLFRSKY